LHHPLQQLPGVQSFDFIRKESYFLKNFSQINLRVAQLGRALAWGALKNDFIILRQVAEIPLEK